MAKENNSKPARQLNMTKCLEMNKDVLPPNKEMYHFKVRTATRDLAIVDPKQTIKDWDRFVSPTKYKAFKNNLPGRNGAPYDYTKYLELFEEEETGEQSKKEDQNVDEN